MFYARGFYSYLSGPPRDWSGVEALAAVRLQKAFSAGALFHHELREEVGDYGQLSGAIRLAPRWHLLPSVGAGNGAFYLPITQLDLELRGPLLKAPWLGWGFGGGAGWWTETRRELSMTLAVMLWASRSLSGEQRMQLAWFGADAAPGRWLVRTTTTLFEGRPGKRTFQQRISIGERPQYVHGGDLSVLPDRVTFDFALGFREWIGPNYGYILNWEYGGQHQTYSRAGFDFSVFAEL